jgi:hypothetical protein
MVMATWQETVTAVGSIATAAFAFLVVIQIYQNRLSRDAAVTIDMARRWDEKLVREARIAVNDLSREQLLVAIRENTKTADPRYMKLTTEANYYEDLAILCRHKAVDLEIVRDAWGDSITDKWKKWEMAIEWLRQPDPNIPRDPLIYEHFDWLAREMAKPKPPSMKPFREWLSEPWFTVSFK